MAREKQPPNDARKGAPRLGHDEEAQVPPARAAAYIPPMAAPKESRYHTIDMKAVRLSPEIDPQRMKTQLSLRAVRANTERSPSRVMAWIALLLTGGAIGTCAWWFFRWQLTQHASQPVYVVGDVPRGLPSAAPIAPLPTPPEQTQLSPLPSATIDVLPHPSETTPVSRVIAEPPRSVTHGGEAKSSKNPVRSAPRAKDTSSKANEAPQRPVEKSNTTDQSQPKLWLE